MGEAAKKKLKIAEKHLEKVQAAWDDPTDWDDLSIYGLYTFENAVQAAAEHLSISWQPTHASQMQVAKLLAEKHGLPDVTDVLKDLNSMRLYSAYGDRRFTNRFDSEDIASQAEGFVDAVRELVT